MACSIRRSHIVPELDYVDKAPKSWLIRAKATSSKKQKQTKVVPVSLQLLRANKS